MIRVIKEDRLQPTIKHQFGAKLNKPPFDLGPVDVKDFGFDFGYFHVLPGLAQYQFQTPVSRGLGAAVRLFALPFNYPTRCPTPQHSTHPPPWQQPPKPRGGIVPPLGVGRIPGYLSTKMLCFSQIRWSCFGQTVTVTSPKCALRNSNICSRPWPIPPPIESGISSRMIIL